MIVSLHSSAIEAPSPPGLDRDRLPLFAHPASLAGLRTQALPWLRTFPYSAIWVPQCGCGADVYSLAILLEEAGLYDRARIYATDDDAALLARAATGAFEWQTVATGAEDYRLAGGSASLARYFADRCGRAVAVDAIRRGIVWCEYDAARGETFNEFNLILARWPLDARTPEDAQHLSRLLADSLAPSGLLALGAEAAAPDPGPGRAYKVWNGACRIHQRTW